MAKSDAQAEERLRGVLEDLMPHLPRFHPGVVAPQ
jgi:hypothetical protein